MTSVPDPYAESIDPSISCGDCEAVCCRFTVVLMPEDHVPEWLIDRESHQVETLAKDASGWCAAIDHDTWRCTIYESRPVICRKFAMGGPGCRYERSRWFGGKAVPTPVVLIDH